MCATVCVILSLDDRLVHVQICFESTKPANPASLCLLRTSMMCIHTHICLVVALSTISAPEGHSTVLLSHLRRPCAADGSGFTRILQSLALMCSNQPGLPMMFGAGHLKPPEPSISKEASAGCTSATQVSIGHLHSWFPNLL